ncbi:MAG: ABC transporter permease, partial [Phycisphaerae bacterium]
MTESLWDEVLARLRVKWVVLRTGIEERLVYRADFVFSTLVRFLPIVTQIFLWNSVFANDGSVKMRGYTYA